MMSGISQFAYLVASALFIFALHWMNTPATARNGVYAGVAATAIAVLVTWAQPGVVHHCGSSWRSSRGSSSACRCRGCRSPRCRSGPRCRTPSAASPPAWSAPPSTTSGFARIPTHLTPFRMVALIAEVILGYLTFTGSLMAAGKLQEVKWVPQRPVTYPLQNVINLVLLGVALVLAVRGDR